MFSIGPGAAVWLRKVEQSLSLRRAPCFTLVTGAGVTVLDRPARFAWHEQGRKYELHARLVALSARRSDATCQGRLKRRTAHGDLQAAFEHQSKEIAIDSMIDANILLHHANAAGGKLAS